MGISCRAYAKLRGVSDTAVRKAIDDGRITKLPDGTIDPETANQQWGFRTSKAIKNIDQDVSESPVPGVSSTKTVTPYAVSRAERESVEVLLKKLELGEKSGKLVVLKDMQADAFNAARFARDKLLNIPDRVAPKLVGERDIYKIKETLRKEIIASLENLTDFLYGNQS